MSRRRSAWLWRVLGLLLLAAAGAAFHSRELIAAALMSNPTPATAASLERGAQQWSRTCAPCHGPKARGDGPVAASLPKRPKDLSRIAAPPVLPDGILVYRIEHGIGGMPAWQGTLGRDTIWDLVNFIRSQKQPGP